MNRSRYFFPSIVFVAIWIPGSVYRAYEFGRRVRFTGPGHDSWTPFIDSFTQTAWYWTVPSFFAGVTIFVFERWLEERKSHSSSSGSAR